MTSQTPSSALSLALYFLVLRYIGNTVILSGGLCWRKLGWFSPLFCTLYYSVVFCKDRKIFPSGTQILCIKIIVLSLRDLSRNKLLLSGVMKYCLCSIAWDHCILQYYFSIIIIEKNWQIIISYISRYFKNCGSIFDNNMK